MYFFLCVYECEIDNTSGLFVVIKIPLTFSVNAMDIRDKVHSYILEEEIVKSMGVKIQFQDTSNIT